MTRCLAGALDSVSSNSRLDRCFDTISVTLDTYLRPFIQSTNAIISVLKVSLWGDEGLAILGAHELLHSDRPPILLCIDIAPTRLSQTAVSWDRLKSIVASAGFDGLAMVCKDSDMRTCKIRPAASASEVSSSVIVDIGVSWFVHRSYVQRFNEWSDALGKSDGN